MKAVSMQFGVKEPTLQSHGASGSGQILLQMPGVDDPERVKRLDRRIIEIGIDENCRSAESVARPNLSYKRSG